MKNSPKISDGVHFIGIGGIGVSALAKYYLLNGWRVTGSDLTSSEITDALKQMGARIFIGPHKAKRLTKKVKQVIYSPAVQKNNPELKKARKLRIKCQSYPEALGELTKNHFAIAVSGTHGKSTTTAMIGLLLTKAGFNPTVIFGTKLKAFGDSNCRVGKSPAGKLSASYGARKYLVIEADEHLASFLNYWPKMIVLTNIEKEHLDYYKNLNNIIRAYKKYIGHLPKNGVLIANKDDKNIRRLTNKKKQKTIFYSLKQKEAKKIKKVLKIPGQHNVYNALAVLTTARILRIPDKISFKALAEYRGAWRRFEEKTIKLKTTNYKLVSDYGHHPTEIRATVTAAKEKYSNKKIWVVFQPHQYQRTYYLFNDFVDVFKELPIEKLIITDIFDVVGREDKIIRKKVSSKKLIKAINRPEAIYLTKKNIIDYLEKNLKGREVVIIMGAGDIYQLSLGLQKIKR